MIAPTGLQLDQVGVRLAGPRGWGLRRTPQSGRTLLHPLSLRVAPGERWAIVGPNGAGKSTLMRLMYGRVAPSEGEVRLSGRPLAQWPAPELARCLAVLPQSPATDVMLSVRQYVALGRTPHRGHSDPAQDLSCVDRALACCGLTDWQDRPMAGLSGGERQRAGLALALAQDPLILLLDEPTNHLDLRARATLLDDVRRLGLTTVAVLHDLALVWRFADRVALLDRGHLRAVGTPRQVLTPDTVREVFGLTVHEMAVCEQTTVRAYEPCALS